MFIVMLGMRYFVETGYYLLARISFVPILLMGIPVLVSPQTYSVFIHAIMKT